MIGRKNDHIMLQHPYDYRKIVRYIFSNCHVMIKFSNQYLNPIYILINKKFGLSLKNSEKNANPKLESFGYFCNPKSNGPCFVEYKFCNRNSNLCNLCQFT